MTEEQQAECDLVRRHVEQLGEHFDTVHVFCTRHDPATEDGTVTVQRGLGNWYARYGQIREWLVKADESARIYEQRSYDKD